MLKKLLLGLSILLISNLVLAQTTIDILTFENMVLSDNKITPGTGLDASPNPFTVGDIVSFTGSNVNFIFSETNAPPVEVGEKVVIRLRMLQNSDPDCRMTVVYFGNCSLGMADLYFHSTQ